MEINQSLALTPRLQRDPGLKTKNTPIKKETKKESVRSCVQCARESFSTEPTSVVSPPPPPSTWLLKGREERGKIPPCYLKPPPLWSSTPLLTHTHTSSSQTRFNAVTQKLKGTSCFTTHLLGKLLSFTLRTRFFTISQGFFPLTYVLQPLASRSTFPSWLLYKKGHKLSYFPSPQLVLVAYFRKPL